MLRIRELTLSRGVRRLLEGADLTVHDRHKVGVVGANGSGKSSLFAAIRGELVADAGAIDLPPGWTLAHVAQETPATPIPAIDYVLDGDQELRALERKLADPDAHDGAHVAELHHRFEAIGGYGARARAATLLAGLGFSEAL
jgi:ATP-binding cassette, subfamily F, member 3